MHDRIIGTFIEREYYVWCGINSLNTWPVRLAQYCRANDLSASDSFYTCHGWNQ
jgi:hypothetical protein